MSMKKNAKISALALVLLTLILSVVSAYGFRYGQSATSGADYVILEGTAGNDYYDSMQYSYKVNQWAYEWEFEGYENGFDPGDDYFSAKKSLRIGVTEYGEFATPVNAGIAYGTGSSEWANTESWASTGINPKYWIQGWTLLLNYTRAGVYRKLMAYAIYSDMVTVEAGRKVYSWYGDYDPDKAAAQLTLGSLVPTGIKILYDSARLAVARASVTIHDGFYDEDVAKITFTIVYNKVTKYAIVYKDLKILLDPKILDAINELTFSERYELDMVRKINPANRAYIHYYHNYDDTPYQHPLTGQDNVDAIQAFDPGRNYIFFAGYWPNATEYSVYSPLVPDVPSNLLRVLKKGTAIADMPSPPTEPSTPWVIVQWRYNYTCWPNMLTWLAKESPKREMRFVEVIGMTDYTDNPHPALDAAVDGVDQIDVEVWYLLDQVFNPEDLTTVGDTWTGYEPFMWTAVGQSAATTDSGGAGFVASNNYGWHATSMVMFDRNDTVFPWLAPVITMKGSIPYGLVEFGGNYIESFTNVAKGTGSDSTKFWRTALKDFAFHIYDDDYESPPQPIAGGWSYYDYYWYPSKNPLSERWAYDEGWYEDPYDEIDYSPNGIITLGGPKANGITRYFNDFGFAIQREGQSGVYRALVNAGAVTGYAPTSNPANVTIDYLPISSWASSKDTWGYTSGYAVISLARDINGTRGLAIYGWDGRDTFWATAWASQYILGPSSEWVPSGAVAVILRISYNDAMEPSGFRVVKALGTITEFGDNEFESDPAYGFDDVCGTRTPPDWTGYIDISEYPYGYIEGGKVWWYEKLHTDSTAEVEFDA
ncbi:MAG: hypothetical protein QXX08_01575 [Candidatus Bathyarchaeia archaeon]